MPAIAASPATKYAPCFALKHIGAMGGGDTRVNGLKFQLMHYQFPPGTSAQAPLALPLSLQRNNLGLGYSVPWSVHPFASFATRVAVVTTIYHRGDKRLPPLATSRPNCTDFMGCQQTLPIATLGWAGCSAAGGRH